MLFDQRTNYKVINNYFIEEEKKLKQLYTNKQHMLHSLLIFRCLDADVCKDVSFSGCPIKNSHKIKKGIQANAISCQETCAYDPNCKYFRFTENVIYKCSFLEDDY